MLNNIEKFIDDLNLQGSVFCDLFVGSCSVADRFKDRYSLICNDTLESSCVITRAKINNSETPSFAKFKECYGVDIFDYFTQKEYDYEESHFIWMN
ncbi:MAG: DNA adenine methylase, partial [Candidatus Borkfalkiaceae bacterium]|nr:DNA adenine methylase [Christensenellaceae bacterium]